MRIREYKKQNGVPIFADYDVADDEPVYIGQGQGCNTFWFKNVADARRFVDYYRENINVTKGGHVSGLILKSLCKGCKHHYSHGSKEWKRAEYDNCFDYKELLKKKVGGG